MSKDHQQKLALTAVVLAGGRSLRMGVDKTQIDIGGQALVTRAVNAVAPFAAQVIIVTNRPENLPLAQLPDNIEIITDEVAYQGPLGGLATALKVARHQWALTVAADMPWISEAVVRLLWGRRSGADIVVPVGELGPEPLLALYRVAAAGPVAQSVLASGRRRLAALFPDLRVCEVALSELREFDPQLATLFNINTQTDLDVARAFAQATGRDLEGAPSHKKSKHPAATPTAAAAGAGTGDLPAPAGAKRGGVRVMTSVETGRQMPIEAPITIVLNDEEVATTQATPKDLDDLAVGFLVSEGLLTDRSAFRGVDIDSKRGLVYVATRESVPDDLATRTRYLTSGCGTGVTFASLGHARGLQPLDAAVELTPNDLYRWMAELADKSADYKDRGGYHSCGLVIGGQLALVREDIGRHNAVDKVLGHAWRAGIDLTQAVLLSSGRISYEMIVKAAKNRVPVVGSRSAATNLATEVAEDLGITLAGYIRGGKVVLYAHPERVIAENEEASQ